MLRTEQIGYVGAAPELRFIPSGDAVATVRVATTNRWKDGDAERERTTWLMWECWGKSAENLAKYMQKGALVFIEGTIRNETWQDKEGNTQYRDKYVVGRWQLLGRKAENGAAAGTDGASAVTGDEASY